MVLIRTGTGVVPTPNANKRKAFDCSQLTFYLLTEHVSRLNYKRKDSPAGDQGCWISGEASVKHFLLSSFYHAVPLMSYDASHHPAAVRGHLSTPAVFFEGLLLHHCTLCSVD